MLDNINVDFSDLKNLIEKYLKNEFQNVEKKVFLGGTCAGPDWREYVKSKLKIPYFDPIVKNWNREAQEEESRQKLICKYNLYVITPYMKGCYSIAEMVDDSNKIPDDTIVCILTKYKDKEFGLHEKKSFDMILRLLKLNGTKVFTNLDDTINYINNL